MGLSYADTSSNLFTIDLFNLGTIRFKQNPLLALTAIEVKVLSTIHKA